MRACRKYALVTVSSKVNASLSSSTTRGLTGCTGFAPLFDSLGLWTGQAWHTSSRSALTHLPQVRPAPVWRATSLTQVAPLAT